MAMCTQGPLAAKHTNTDEFLLSLQLRVRGQLGTFPPPPLLYSLCVHRTAKSIHLSFHVLF